jgi:hypothetical protein
MKKQITKSQLKALIKEVRLFLVEENLKDKESSGEDSVDSQIDAYFSRYESEAKNSKNEGLDFRLFMRRFLNEADEDKDDDKNKDKDKEDVEDKKIEKLSIDDLDVNSFADSVVRLADNYDSLLEMRNTIFRRAVSFLAKNYEVDVADAFKESLSERHGLTIGKSKSESDDENFQPPPADRAGASPGGA